MAVPTTISGFEELSNLEPALRKVFFDQLEAVNDPTSLLNEFFNIETLTDEAQIQNLGMGGFSDTPDYTPGGAIASTDFSKLYKKTYLPKHKADQYVITAEALRTTRYSVFERTIQQRGIAANRTIYKQAAAIFNGAFGVTNAENTGGDAKALCATDHPSGGTAAAQSNKGTTALSVDAVIDAQEAMMGFTDSLGNPTAYMPDTLVVPLGLMNTAQTIIQSPLRSGVANNDANTLGGLRLVVSKYLTDSNNWFLIDSTQAKMMLNWYWIAQPNYVIHPASSYDLETRERVYYGYMVGFDDWRWIYGSEVA